VTHREVPLDLILSEIVSLENSKEDAYRTEFLRLRVEVVQMYQEEADEAIVHKSKQPIIVSQLLQSFTERDPEWMEDSICCLED